MSLINIYGSYKNDLDRIITSNLEVYKYSSLPLIVYPVFSKEELSKTSEHNLYGSYTEKRYNIPIEIKGFFKNPVLVQNLIQIGIDIPETITIYFNMSYMLKKYGKPIQLYDIIQFPHQRNQIYMVRQSLPHNFSERFFKYIQWLVVVEKEELSGIVLPPYLLYEKDGLISWFTFSDHYNTEFLHDRQAYLEQRKYKIEGDIRYFWKEGSFWDDIEIGNFNGIDNYLNFYNNYNFKQNPFTIEFFIKPQRNTNQNYYYLFQKGNDFKIYYDNNGSIFFTIGSKNIQTNSNLINFDIWNYLCFVVSPQNLIVYKNNNNFINIVSYTFPIGVNYNILNEDNFIIGGNKVANNEIINLYKGKFSNLRIFFSALTQEQVLKNEFTNLKNRGFMNY